MLEQVTLLQQPFVAVASALGVQEEPDRRWRDFLDSWIEYNRGSRQIAGWMRDALLAMGVKPESIPANAGSVGVCGTGADRQDTIDVDRRGDRIGRARDVTNLAAGQLGQHSILSSRHGRRRALHQGLIRPSRQTGRDNGTTDRGYGGCGDGRVKSPAMTGRERLSYSSPYPDANGHKPRHKPKSNYIDQTGPPRYPLDLAVFAPICG